MSIRDESAARTLRQAADDALAGDVVVHTTTRHGCGATGCEEPDLTILVHHIHKPDVPVKGETS